MDIFQALEMFSASWKTTSKEVIHNCFRKAGFEHGLARTASTLEACDSVEDSEEAIIAAHALSEENDQAGLEEARRHLESDGAIPDGVALDDFLYADSCVIATKEVRDDSIVQDVLENTEEDPGSDTDAEDVEAPSNHEVLDAIDVLRCYASSTWQHDAMQSPWAYERTVRPHLMSKQTQKKVTDYFQRK
ncbi:hypothetical protein HPB48_018184 [Haemaphysalis longicornis]|uniref:Tick transposon n=1 Tax=Haemaphysalis longicornis TaxID=44386 RepID=A0A9J6GZX3_HAELO|nr:hypothetical protein HPB48_018184 [Haemaphysalis longicornis]